jgi:hypothetical protein
MRNFSARSTMTFVGRVRPTAILALAILVIPGCNLAPSEAGRTPAQPAPARDLAAEGRAPEDVFRAFLVAVVSGDDRRVRQLVVDRPGVEILYGGRIADDRERRELIEAFRSMPVRRVDGDGPGRVTLFAPDDPVPYAMVRVDGAWRYDPADLISEWDRSRRGGLPGE